MNVEVPEEFDFGCFVGAIFAENIICHSEIINEMERSGGNQAEMGRKGARRGVRICSID